MASLFIAVIYLAFISLGLPDSLLGSAWLVMHTELGASLFRGRHQPHHLSFHHRLGALFQSARDEDRRTARHRAERPFDGACDAFFLLCGSFLAALPFGCSLRARRGRHRYDAQQLHRKTPQSAAHELAALLLGHRRLRRPLCDGLLPLGREQLAGRISYDLRRAVRAHAHHVPLPPLWKKTAEQNGTEEKEIALPPQKTLCLKGALCLFLAGLFYFAIEQLPIVWASTFFSEVYTLDSETAAL